MKGRKTLFWTATVLFGVVAVIILLTYLLGTMPMPTLAMGDERTIVLEVVWGGDIYSSEEASCDVWTAQFNCELRRGGDLGVVISQTLPLLGPVAMPDPPEAGVVVTTTLTWDTSSLLPGPYETWCRLELTNGIEDIWGYIAGQGQELDGYCMADKFVKGETCGVARMFFATVQ